jgi:hypothetical protein
MDTVDGRNAVNHFFEFLSFSFLRVLCVLCGERLF